MKFLTETKLRKIDNVLDEGVNYFQQKLFKDFSEDIERTNSQFGIYEVLELQL